MVYIVTIACAQLDRQDADLRATQRLTKTFAKTDLPHSHASALTLVLGRESDGSRFLAWIGVATQRGTAGMFDGNLTIDPLRPVHDIPAEGEDGFLARLDSNQRARFDEECRLGSVGSIDEHIWGPIAGELRGRNSYLTRLLDYLQAIAVPPRLDPENSADMSWQEQRDAVGVLTRIADLPPNTTRAWTRPSSRADPYLAGLIPEPVEAALIEQDLTASGRKIAEPPDSFDTAGIFDHHDIRTVPPGAELFDDWVRDESVRCDIHVFTDPEHDRTVEIANVNATPVEARLGTDLIYYHHQTKSFVLVQYKRLNPATRTVSVDDRLYRQLARLETVEQLSTAPARPDDWRLSPSACFLKLAYWPDNGGRATDLADGMYLPVSYVRLLLDDPCTLSGRTRKDGSAGRVLGYPQVPRRLTNTQFIDLVKHGFAGTIGVTVEQLRELVDDRIRAGANIVLAYESSSESSHERSRRIHSRVPRKVVHRASPRRPAPAPTPHRGTGHR
ncbi:hypothetical protein [Nocardia carnea]|uniref:Uncharacterized protein n=1 Tax=Nocardia carnea TaxID=37328 RepID=A0ABW7TVC7_9NOCA|nr:hypothetical protein [Nocardia carnea]